MECTVTDGTLWSPPGSPAEGGPEFVQLLTPEGERCEHPDYSFDLDDGAIKGFYRDMALTRRIDAEAIALQRQGELGIWASLLGQEAAQIGSGRAVRTQDFIFPTYREHGVAKKEEALEGERLRVVVVNSHRAEQYKLNL